MVAVRSGTEELAHGTLEGRVRIRDEEVYDHPSAVAALAWGPKGNLVASLHEDGRLVVSTAGGELLYEADLSVEPSSAAFAPGAERIAVGTTEGDILFFDPRRGRVTDHWTARATRPISALAFEPGGSRLASASSGVSILDVENGNSLLVLECDEDVLALSFDAEGKRLAAGTSAGRLVVWETEVDTAQRTWRIHAEAVEHPDLLEALGFEFGASTTSIADRTDRVTVEQLLESLLDVEAVRGAIHAMDHPTERLDRMRILLEEYESPDRLHRFVRSAVLDPYLSSNGYERALSAAQRVLDADPERSTYLITEGAALHRCGRHDEARRTLRSALPNVEERDELAIGQAFLSLSAQALGDFVEALEARERALDLLPKELRGLRRELESALPSRGD